MYTQFVIALIGIHNEANPLAHKWELYKLGGMIDDAGAYGKITYEELRTLHNLYKTIRDEIDEFDNFLMGGDKMNRKYRVDYFTDKHNKRYFDYFDLAYQFAFNMSIKSNVSAAFILELIDPDKCLYDVVIQV